MDPYDTLTALYNNFVLYTLTLVLERKILKFIGFIKLSFTHVACDADYYYNMVMQYHVMCY